MAHRGRNFSEIQTVSTLVIHTTDLLVGTHSQRPAKTEALLVDKRANITMIKQVMMTNG